MQKRAGQERAGPERAGSERAGSERAGPERAGRDAGPGVPLAAGLVTRLCHDLAGPLVGVLAALELAAEATAGGAAEDDPLAVAMDSARHLAARLALLRAAWGQDPGPLDGAGLRALADGLPNRARLSLDMDGMGPEPVSGPVGQLLLNMVLLAAMSLPKGGGIALGRDGAAFSARIAGPNAAWPGGLQARLLAPDMVEPAARAVVPVLLGLLARQSGARLGLPEAGGPAGAGPGPLLLTIA